MLESAEHLSTLTQQQINASLQTEIIRLHGLSSVVVTDFKKIIDLIKLLSNKADLLGIKDQDGNTIIYYFLKSADLALGNLIFLINVIGEDISQALACSVNKYNETCLSLTMATVKDPTVTEYILKIMGPKAKKYLVARSDFSERAPLSLAFHIFDEVHIIHFFSFFSPNEMLENFKNILHDFPKEDKDCESARKVCLKKFRRLFKGYPSLLKNLDGYSPELLLGITDNSHESVLHYTVRYGDVISGQHVINLFDKRFIEACQLRNKDGLTALCCAFRYADVNVIALLLETLGVQTIIKLINQSDRNILRLLTGNCDEAVARVGRFVVDDVASITATNQQDMVDYLNNNLAALLRSKQELEARKQQRLGPLRSLAASVAINHKYQPQLFKKCFHLPSDLTEAYLQLEINPAKFFLGEIKRILTSYIEQDTVLDKILQLSKQNEGETQINELAAQISTLEDQFLLNLIKAYFSVSPYNNIIKVLQGMTLKMSEESLEVISFRPAYTELRKIMAEILNRYNNNKILFEKINTENKFGFVLEWPSPPKFR